MISNRFLVLSFLKEALFTAEESYAHWLDASREWDEANEKGLLEEASRLALRYVTYQVEANAKEIALLKVLISEVEELA